MALKTNVVDRVPTYPGRVKLTPVSGQENTYDLVRADAPVTEGTRINAELLNRKVDQLLESAMIYVDGQTGSDVVGDGSSGAPYATIQAAVDSLPKSLGGFEVTIHINAGEYREAVNVNGFYGGKLIIGYAANNVTVNSVSVRYSSCVELNVWAIDGDLYVGADSNVTLLRSLTIVGGSILVEHGSKLVANDFVYVNYASQYAITARSGSTVSLLEIGGMNNVRGLCAETGGLITCSENDMTDTGDDKISSGGRIFIGSNNSATTFSVVGTFVANNWVKNGSVYTQTIDVAGVLSTDDPFVDVYLGDVDTYSEVNNILDAWYCVHKMIPVDGAINAYCYSEKPTVDVPIIVKVVR